MNWEEVHTSHLPDLDDTRSGRWLVLLSWWQNPQLFLTSSTIHSMTKISRGSSSSMTPNLWKRNISAQTPDQLAGRQEYHKNEGDKDYKFLGLRCGVEG